MTEYDSSPPAPVAQDTLVVVETLVLCAGRKLSMADFVDAFWGSIEESEVTALLAALAERWATKGFELAHDRGLWWPRARPAMQAVLNKAAPAPTSRPSRALLETLAVIAYRQPCTKADIEEIRRMSVPSPVLDGLLARGWIEVIGLRHDPQESELYATTNKFLDELGLYTLEDLPAIDAATVVPDPVVEEPDPDPDFVYEPYDGPIDGDLGLPRADEPPAVLSAP